MSGTEFVKLTEKNEHECETWVFWLQYTGNEKEIAKLDALLKDWQANSRYDVDQTLDLTPLVGEQVVDILVEYTPEGYMSYFNKVTGTFTCPEDPGLDEVTEEWEDPNNSREDLFYKGQIRDYFRA